MSHVVSCDLRPRPRPQHQVGMHRPETAEVDLLGQAKRQRRGLDLPV